METGKVVTTLEWYATSYGDIFPGCKDCCYVTLSPMAHEAMDSYKLEPDESGDLPVFKEVVAEYHTNGHSYAPTPLSLTGRKRRRAALQNLKPKGS